MSEESFSDYSPRRKVIVEKYSEYERSKVINFLREKKNIAVRSQQYEVAAMFRDAENYIDLDFNIVEEHVFIWKNYKIICTADGMGTE